jgi:hypothetical protein
MEISYANPLRLRRNDLRLLNTLPTHAPTTKESRAHCPRRQVKDLIHCLIVCKYHARDQIWRNHTPESCGPSIDDGLRIDVRGIDGKGVFEAGTKDGLGDREEEGRAEGLKED